MAELLDVGKHCELSSCNRLDFTPFQCRMCSKSFCTDHRFSHGCVMSKEYDPSTATSSSTPLRPYLCSFKDCSIAESIKVVCPFCQVNFCLTHRHAVDHSCQHIPEAERTARMKSTLADIRAAVGVQGQPQPAVVQKEKMASKPNPVVLSEADQKKADRIAVMKLKMSSSKSGLGANEQMIVFVESTLGRQPVLLGKNWTIGRAVDSIRTTLGLKNEENLRLSLKSSGEVLEFSETVQKCLKELDSLILE